MVLRLAMRKVEANDIDAGAKHALQHFGAG
jgi:hypothetical protein